LEGLGGLEASLVKRFIQDTNPRLRKQGLRAAETLFKYGEKGFVAEFAKATLDADPEVAIQALLSAHVLKVDQLENLIKTAIQQNSTPGVQLIGAQLLEKMNEAKKTAETRFGKEELALFIKGKSIFDSYCSTCHGPKGLGSPAGDGRLIAPPFSGSPRILGHPEYAVKVMLHGLKGAIDAKEYEGVMIAMNGNDDEYIASVLSYIRNDFGNSAAFISPEYVGQIREETAARKANYGFDELVAEIPKPLTFQENWKVTASSTALQGVGATKDPGYAFSFKGWRTDTSQEPGMWFQVQLPTPQRLTEVQFDSGKENYPVQYTVSVSSDGRIWTEVAQAKGVVGNNKISWTPVGNSTFIKLETKAKGDYTWSMKKLTFYAR
jgi:mono/diheme cytochrome c family protein